MAVEAFPTTEENNIHPHSLSTRPFSERYHQPLRNLTKTTYQRQTAWDMAVMIAIASVYVTVDYSLKGIDSLREQINKMSKKLKIAA